MLGADGRFPAEPACNRFAGGYVLDGAFLTFGLVATTRMYCAMCGEQERASSRRCPRWRNGGSTATGWS